MSGYATLVAPCFVCGRPFTSNPLRVPSYQNNPICKPCIELVNQKRIEAGKEPWPIPEDAYEACREGELP
jgi:hypothetical protein